MSQPRPQTPAIMPGCEPFAYKTASGRARWLNRDPAEEAGGSNVYSWCLNNSHLHYDALGNVSVKVMLQEDRKPGYQHNLIHSGLPTSKDHRGVQVVKTTHKVKTVGNALSTAGPNYHVDTFKSLSGIANDIYLTVFSPESETRKYCFIDSEDEATVGWLSIALVKSFGIEKANSDSIDSSKAKSIVSKLKSKHTFTIRTVFWLDENEYRQEFAKKTP
jgi:hypothetical protein